MVLGCPRLRWKRSLKAGIYPIVQRCNLLNSSNVRAMVRSLVVALKRRSGEGRLLISFHIAPSLNQIQEARYSARIASTVAKNPVAGGKRVIDRLELKRRRLIRSHQWLYRERLYQVNISVTSCYGIT